MKFLTIFPVNVVFFQPWLPTEVHASKICKLFYREFQSPVEIHTHNDYHSKHSNVCIQAKTLTQLNKMAVSISIIARIIFAFLQCHTIQYCTMLCPVLNKLSLTPWLSCFPRPFNLCTLALSSQMMFGRFSTQMSYTSIVGPVPQIPKLQGLSTVRVESRQLLYRRQNI